MKINKPAKDALASLFVSSSLVAAPVGHALAETFTVNCNGHKDTVKQLSVNVKNFPEGTVCSIDQIPQYNIGVFCRSNSGFSSSDTRMIDSSRHHNDYTSFRMSIGRDGGQYAQSRILISNVDSELTIAIDANYNTSFDSKQTLFIAKHQTDTNCDILPFTWDEDTSC